MKLITCKDISVVIQGLVLRDVNGENITKKVFIRIKELLPDCELILSTWEGQDASDINYDKVVYSVDPGAHWFDIHDPSFTNNTNRMILSTQNSIKEATRRYTLKLRSDLYLHNLDFLKYFGKYNSYDEKYKVFEQRILIYSLFSIKYHDTGFFKQYKPYHLSDWAFFGLTDDVRNFYNIPLAPEPESSHWFLDKPKHFSDIHPHRVWRMPPEQYVTYQCFKRYFDINLEHMSDVSNNNMDLSERIIANNFVILDQDQLRIYSHKRQNIQYKEPPLVWNGMYRHKTWLKDYMRLANGKYHFHFSWVELLRIPYSIYYRLKAFLQ